MTFYEEIRIEKNVLGEAGFDHSFIKGFTEGTERTLSLGPVLRVEFLRASVDAGKLGNQNNNRGGCVIC